MASGKWQVVKPSIEGHVVVREFVVSAWGKGHREEVFQCVSTLFPTCHAIVPLGERRRMLHALCSMLYAVRA